MAANIAHPTEDEIATAMSMAEYYDRTVMISALQAKNNDLQAVMNEWFDDSEKVSTSLPHDGTCSLPWPPPCSRT